MGDYAEVVRHLLQAWAQDALVAGIANHSVVASYAELGTVGFDIGSGLEVRGRVIHLNLTREPLLAVVRVDGVNILLTADRQASTTKSDLVVTGIDLRTRKLVVKLSYLFPEL